MKKIRGVLVIPMERAKDHTFDYNTFEDLYPLLDCDTFTIVTRRFGKHLYDIYLDDEGLLNEKPVAIFTRDKVTNTLVEILVGNCFVCKHDEEGDIMSLTDNEVKEVLDSNVRGVMYCEL